MADQKNNAEDFAKLMRPLQEHSEANVKSGGTVDFGGGNIGSVQSGSVQDSRLNNGKPTLIPFIWNGKKVSGKEAIERAVKSGVKWPVFDTNEQATEASIQLSNSLGLSKNDPEIQKLTETVMEAAAGKPLKVSITEQRRQQQIVESFIGQFRERQLSEGQAGESSVQTASEGNVSKPTPSSDASSKSDSNPVTTDDLVGIQKSIEKLSSDLAQVSK